MRKGSLTLESLYPQNLSRLEVATGLKFSSSTTDQHSCPMKKMQTRETEKRRQKYRSISATTTCILEWMPYTEPDL